MAKGIRNGKAAVLLSLIEVATALSPATVFAQQKMQLSVNKLSREEAKDKANYISFEISKLPSSQNKWAECDRIKDELFGLMKQTDDKEVQYASNFLMSRLIFERDTGTFSGTFDFLEKCVFEYSEQERKFGLAYNALQKIGAKFSEQKRLIGTSLCYELSNLSPYPNKNSSELKKSLDSILNTEIGGLPLSDAFNKMFDYDGGNVRVRMDYIPDARGFKEIDNYRGQYIDPIPEGWMIAMTYPIDELNEVQIVLDSASQRYISNPTKKFPSMKLKNVKVNFQGKTPNALFVCGREEINAKEFVDKSSLTMEFEGRGSDYALRRCEEESARISKQESVTTSPRSMYDYLVGGALGRTKSFSGWIFPLSLRKNVRIRDFLQIGEVDPYNWFYKGVITNTDSLKNLEW
jgi:hypothetical protein